MTPCPGPKHHTGVLQHPVGRNARLSETAHNRLEDTTLENYH